MSKCGCLLSLHYQHKGRWNTGRPGRRWKDQKGTNFKTTGCSMVAVRRSWWWWWRQRRRRRRRGEAAGGAQPDGSTATDGNITNFGKSVWQMVSTPCLWVKSAVSWLHEQPWLKLWGAHRVLVGKPEGRIPLGRPRRRREDNITTDLTEVGRLAWTGSIRFRTGTGGGLLWMR